MATDERPAAGSGRRTLWIVVGLALIALPLLIFFVVFSVRIVPDGQVGILYTFGEVDLEPRQPGLVIKRPWASMQTMNVDIQEFTAGSTSDEYDPLTAGTVETLTCDGLTIGIDLTVRFRLDATRAAYVFRDIGPEFKRLVMPPTTRGAIRNILIRFRRQDLYPTPPANLGSIIQEYLETDLEPHGIIIEQVLLTDIVPPAEIQEAEALKAAVEAELERIWAEEAAAAQAAGLPTPAPSFRQPAEEPSAAVGPALERSPGC